MVKKRTKKKEEKEKNKDRQKEEIDGTLRMECTTQNSDYGLFTLQFTHEGNSVAFNRHTYGTESFAALTYNKNKCTGEFLQ